MYYLIVIYVKMLFDKAQTSVLKLYALMLLLSFMLLDEFFITLGYG